MQQKNETLSFATMVLAPGFCFLLGMILIYLTNTPWQFAPTGIDSAVLWGLSSGILVYLLLAIFTRLPIARSLRDIVRQLRPLFRDMNFLQMLILALMAGIGEEVFFRGFLQRWLSGFMAAEFAIAIAATIFGLLHFASVSYFLLTTLLGLALGITYFLTDSLLLIIVWHSSYDLIAIWMLTRHPRLLGIEPAE